jgi:positive regulator of sigma E activity
LRLSAFAANIIMGEIGKVMKTNKNMAIVLVEDNLSCVSCEFSKFCRIGKKEGEIICWNHKGAKEGDLVQLQTSNKILFTTTVLIFVLPLFILIGGVILGGKIYQTDIAGFIAGMGSMTIYFVIFLFMDKKILKAGFFLPEPLILRYKKSFCCTKQSLTNKSEIIYSKIN